MKKLLILAALVLAMSCSKEEFAINKGVQNGAVNPIISTSTKLCSQHTLVSPQVDILLLWDNSSSFNFVTSATKSSLSQLISSVSENFDYHILSAPLVPANKTPLYEGTLITKNNAGLSGNALGIIKTKEAAVASLGFSPGYGAEEVGIDRATSVIESNRSNGIFRNGAYTIIVIMSNEDDKGCELNSPHGCVDYDVNQYLTPRITKLLCLRGNTYEDCSTSGVSSPLNSSMMRLINISPLTACASGLNNVNTRYRKVAKSIYEASYKPDINGAVWPTANDHLSPDVSGAPDSYNLCSIDFGHIFDGVNAAIKQTLIKHKYEYWPVAGASADIDADTLRVVRSDGKILANRTNESNPMDGYQYVGNLTNQNTRVLPTPGEPFTGKMIRLFGGDGNDRVVYPDCLTVTFDANKLQYGYIYLKYGTADVSTIEVRINGNLVPQSTTNGWDYMGMQLISGLNSSLKVFDLPAGTPSGPIIRLNGTYKFQNSASAPVTVNVLYNN